jgi:serpin B
MHIHHLAVTAGISLCLCLGAGCSSSSSTKSTNSVPAATDTYLTSSMAREMKPQPADADVAAAVTGNNDFALKSFPLLAANANTFFSPYSLTENVLFLAAGANGATLAGIEQAMSISLPQSQLNSAFNKLDLLLADKTKGDGSTMPSLKQISAMWAQKGQAVLPTYLDTLAVNYGQGVHSLDFMRSADAYRQVINNWISAQSGGTLTNYVPATSVSSATRLLLTSAISFKAHWAYISDDSASADFHNRDGSTATSASSISQKQTFPYAAVDGCEAVEVPYAGQDLAMLFLMPTAGTFDTFAAGLTPSILADITSHLAGTEMMLSVPKFKVKTPVSVKALLQQLGMSDAFNAATADFSGINGGRDLFIDNFYQAASIKVDESGTQAEAISAATGAGAGSVLKGEFPWFGKVLTLDHPFIFLIRDRQTGLILFMGKIVSLPS